jgi:hypothetical protein
MNLLQKFYWKIKLRKYSLSNETEPVHAWFGLTYSSYLVLQRSILQSTPIKWQRKFIKLIEELEEMASDIEDLPSKYTVQLRDENGRFIKDPYADYDRGRRIVNLKRNERGKD